MRAFRWLRLLWPRFCRGIVESAQHPGLYPPGEFTLVGHLNGKAVKVSKTDSAVARDAFHALLVEHPTGWLEFRQEGQLRSRYVSPQVP